MAKDTKTKVAKTTKADKDARVAKDKKGKSEKASNETKNKADKKEKEAKNSKASNAQNNKTNNKPAIKKTGTPKPTGVVYYIVDGLLGKNGRIIGYNDNVNFKDIASTFSGVMEPTQVPFATYGLESTIKWVKSSNPQDHFQEFVAGTEIGISNDTEEPNKILRGQNREDLTNLLKEITGQKQCSNFHHPARQDNDDGDEEQTIPTKTKAKTAKAKSEKGAKTDTKTGAKNSDKKKQQSLIEKEDDEEDEEGEDDGEYEYEDDDDDDDDDGDDDDDDDDDNDDDDDDDDNNDKNVAPKKRNKA